MEFDSLITSARKKIILATHAVNEDSILASKVAQIQIGHGNLIDAAYLVTTAGIEERIMVPLALKLVTKIRRIQDRF